jgi:hypothetical protein
MAVNYGQRVIICIANFAKVIVLGLLVTLDKIDELAFEDLFDTRKSTF